MARRSLRFTTTSGSISSIRKNGEGFTPTCSMSIPSSRFTGRSDVNERLLNLVFWCWLPLAVVLCAIVAALVFAPVPSLPDEEQEHYDLLQKIPYATRFDFPVGPPDAKGYYDARPFGRKGHMGSDRNGANGENTDL